MKASKKWYLVQAERRFGIDLGAKSRAYTKFVYVRKIVYLGSFT